MSEKESITNIKAIIGFKSGKGLRLVTTMGHLQQLAIDVREAKPETPNDLARLGTYSDDESITAWFLLSQVELITVTERLNNIAMLNERIGITQVQRNLL